MLSRLQRAGLGGQDSDGLGPEVHTQSQLAQLVAHGKTLRIIPP